MIVLMCVGAIRRVGDRWMGDRRVDFGLSREMVEFGILVETAGMALDLRDCGRSIVMKPGSRACCWRRSPGLGHVVESIAVIHGIGNEDQVEDWVGISK